MESKNPVSRICWKFIRNFDSSRSCHWQMFLKIGVLKNFVNFTKKTYILESLFNKVAGLQASNFIKKRLQHRCFPVKFLRTPIFTEHLRWLLLFIKETCKHDWNLQNCGFSPTLMNSVFIFRNEYVRYFQVLSTDLRKTVNYGLIGHQPFGQNWHLNTNLQFPLKNLE